MATATCTVADCDNPVRNKARGLCNQHYIRLRRHGDVNYRKKHQYELPCAAPGCERRRQHSGLCSMHRYRLRAHGTLDLDRPVEMHGYAGTPTYLAWQNMKARCAREVFAHDYAHVNVCNRWENSFLAFLEDMGERPEGMSLDRIDPTGNYEPANCRWADASTQARNTRTRSDNHSGHKGVCWDAKRGLWRAYVDRHGIRTELGHYESKHHAIAARHAATTDDLDDGIYPCCGARQTAADPICAGAV